MLENDDDDDDDDVAPLLVSVDEISTENASRLPFHSQLLPEPPPPVSPCPVTILSGFLGAGKTTLIQYILQSPDHGKRIAVIENEYGGNRSNDFNNAALSIESIIARDGLTSDSLQDLIELPNGCICCTVKDSLVLTLEQLLNRRSDLDYILIECSGLANPGPIAAMFWLDDALDSRLRLDGIVTVVDSVNIVRQLQETVEASQQIAYADRILLNKVDLLDQSHEDRSSRVERLIKRIRKIHPTVEIRPTTFSAIPDLDWILDAGCFDLQRAQSTLAELTKASTTQRDKNHDWNDLSTCGECNLEDHSHTAAVGTVTVSISGSVDLEKVNLWLASILWPNQDEKEHILRAQMESGREAHDVVPQALKTSQQIFRLKGILSVGKILSNKLVDDSLTDQSAPADDNVFADHRRFIVQGVYDLWDIHPCTTADLFWKDGEARVSKIIIIGCNLEVFALQNSFNECKLII
jgi:G3E family GTPase